MTRLQKKPSLPKEKDGGILVFDFLGPISQELRINLSDFNPGDINQIQDRSQQYQRRLSGL
jgi:hypothetical protein